MIAVRGAKQRALLALLAISRGRPVSSDRLIDQLWGNGQAAKPANALQAQIVQLRRTLGASAIVTTEAGYALDVAADDVDVAQFEDLVAEGRRLSAEGEQFWRSAVLGDALRLRRGEPLSEFAYAGFADAERAHLNELAPGGDRVPSRSRPGAGSSQRTRGRSGGAVPRAPAARARPKTVSKQPRAADRFLRDCAAWLLMRACLRGR